MSSTAPIRTHVHLSNTSHASCPFTLSPSRPALSFVEGLSMNGGKSVPAFIMGTVRAILMLGFCFLSAPLRASADPDSASTLFPYPARVAVEVADLRKEPRSAGSPLAHDPLQESQLLYGDRVRVLEIRGDWARVEALRRSGVATNAGRDTPAGSLASSSPGSRRAGPPMS